MQRMQVHILHLPSHIRLTNISSSPYAAPSAIFIAVVGTGLIGWLLNIVLVLCSGPLYVSLGYSLVWDLNYRGSQ